MTRVSLTSRRVGRRGGMTLMEIILVISIVVSLMGTVYAFYSGALATRDRITTASERIASVRSVMDRMTMEFRAAMVFTVPKVQTAEEAAAAEAEIAAMAAAAAEVAAAGEDGGIDAVAAGAVVEGAQADAIKTLSRLETIGMYGVREPEQSVEFPTVALPGPSAWAESLTTDTDTVVQAVGDVELIGYRLRLDDEGNVVGLERSRRKELVLTDEYEDIDEITEWVLVSPHIKFLRIRYWDSEGQEWLEEWARENESIPPAVEVTLGFTPLPESADPEDYPHEFLRRIIAIPTVAGGGGKAPLVRGLGESGLR